MKILALLLLFFPASAFAITLEYKGDPASRVSTLFYGYPAKTETGGTLPDVNQNWHIGDGYLNATLDTETGEFNVYGLLMDIGTPNGDPSGQFYPGWFSQPLSFHFYQQYQLHLFDYENNFVSQDLELGGFRNDAPINEWFFSNGDLLGFSPYPGSIRFAGSPNMDLLILQTMFGGGTIPNRTIEFQTDIRLTQVPEPSSLALLAIAGAAAAFFRSGRRRTQAD